MNALSDIVAARMAWVCVAQRGGAASGIGKRRHNNGRHRVGDGALTRINAARRISGRRGGGNRRRAWRLWLDETSWRARAAWTSMVGCHGVTCRIVCHILTPGTQYALARSSRVFRSFPFASYFI